MAVRTENIPRLYPIGAARSVTADATARMTPRLTKIENFGRGGAIGGSFILSRVFIHVLAGGDHSGMANDGDEIAVASRLDPNDAKSVVGILVGDALNQPGQPVGSDPPP